MSIRDLPEELQSYILGWCMNEKKCPLENACNELVTRDCAIVRFLSDLSEDRQSLVHLLKEKGQSSWTWLDSC
jgi:hypothetical protein